MSLGLILVIILVIFLLGGFSGRFGGYGYGFGHGGIGLTVSPIPRLPSNSATTPSPPNRSRTPTSPLLPRGCGGNVRGWRGYCQGRRTVGTGPLRLRARHHDIEVLILNVQDSFTEFVPCLQEREFL
jgi:hypothetical protein